jgi:hypothetical protein
MHVRVMAIFVPEAFFAIFMPFMLPAALFFAGAAFIGAAAGGAIGAAAGGAIGAAAGGALGGIVLWASTGAAVNARAAARARVKELYFVITVLPGLNLRRRISAR